MLPGISAKTDQQLLAAYDLKTVHCAPPGEGSYCRPPLPSHPTKRLRKREPSLMLINLISSSTAHQTILVPEGPISGFC